MKRWRSGIGLTGLAVALVFVMSPTSAFVLTTGRPSENVSGPGARAPGLMVNGGVARHAARLDDFESPNDITATRETPGLVDLFLPEWIEIIFEQVNSALDLLINVLFLRAGETPPALSQLTNTTTPASKTKESVRRSLVDRNVERLEHTVR